MSGGIWDVERLRFATEAAGGALWSWNVDTNQITLDALAFELWGIPKQDKVTFEVLSSRIDPADLDKGYGRRSRRPVNASAPTKPTSASFTARRFAGFPLAAGATTRESSGASSTAFSSTSAFANTPNRLAN